MRFYFNRNVKGQTRLGIFTNLGPSKVNRTDRKSMGGWYVSLHLGTVRVSLFGDSWKIYAAKLALKIPTILGLFSAAIVASAFLALGSALLITHVDAFAIVAGLGMLFIGGLYLLILGGVIDFTDL